MCIGLSTHKASKCNFIDTDLEKCKAVVRVVVERAKKCALRRSITFEGELYNRGFLQVVEAVFLSLRRLQQSLIRSTRILKFCQTSCRDADEGGEFAIRSALANGLHEFAAYIATGIGFEWNNLP